MSNTALYIVTVLIWGSTFFAIEFQLGTVAPEVSIVYRFAGASILLMGWARLRGLNMSFRFRQTRPLESFGWVRKMLTTIRAEPASRTMAIQTHRRISHSALSIPSATPPLS